MKTLVSKAIAVVNVIVGIATLCGKEFIVALFLCEGNCIEGRHRATYSYRI